MNSAVQAIQTIASIAHFLSLHLGSFQSFLSAFTTNIQETFCQFFTKLPSSPALGVSGSALRGEEVFFIASLRSVATN